MIARLEVTRGPLTEYPLAEKISGGWQNGVTFYPDAEVTKVTELIVRAAHDEQCEAEYVVGAACYSDCGCSDRSLEAVKAETTTEWATEVVSSSGKPANHRSIWHNEIEARHIANEYQERLLTREVTEWRPVADLQEHGYPQETKQEEQQ